MVATTTALERPVPIPELSRARHGNALRAGVLGSTDGLVSNLCLLMGVAGSGAPHQAIVVAGFAGLVAGALSMALGEYLTDQSSRELLANELRIEAAELAASPDAEVAELRGIYERKGVPPRMAAELAEHMVRSDPVLALDTMAREELGFDPKQLGGSAWVAAGSRCCSDRTTSRPRRPRCAPLARRPRFDASIQTPAANSAPAPHRDSPVANSRGGPLQRGCPVRRQLSGRADLSSDVRARGTAAGSGAWSD